jgi:flagellar biosynthetic protein FliQ
MTETEILEICREGIIVMLKVVGPILVAGLVVGVGVSLLQTITQIQEMTLTFIPKLVVILGLTLLLLPFMLSLMSGFAHSLMNHVIHIESSE